MQRILVAVVILFSLFVMVSGSAQNNISQDYKNPDLPIEQRVEDLLSQMTLQEKVGQMIQIDVLRLMGNGEWDKGPLNESWLKNIFEKNQVGSILSGGGASPAVNTPKAWAEMTNALQEAALKYSRLDIPMIYGIDAVHGHNNVKGATIYPHNIGLGATWNAELVEEVAQRVAADVAAVGTHWTFAPVADVARDPRWGRYYESFSEDAVLASELVAASVRGFQASGEVAATVKHFAAYGQSLTGFDRTPAFLDMRTLRTVHLPPHEAGFSEGALTMMVNSGSVNGIPVHASGYMLQDLARAQLGFSGMIISDWEDIHKLVSVHKVAPDFKSALALSINAGVDMYMVPHDADGVNTMLQGAIQSGLISEARIDEAVSNVLTLKFTLGLFEKPFVDAELANSIVIEKERDLAKQATLETLTLLENNRMLPFSEDIKKILVTGPSANSIPNQMGGWTMGWQGMDANSNDAPGITLIEGIEEGAPEGVEIDYTGRYKETDRLIEKANQADVVVVVLGETPYAEGEGNSETIALPSEQLDLLNTLLTDTSTPVVAILISGRPLIIPETILSSLDAFIMAYLPGSEAGPAVSDVLFGRYSPSGKLPFSWPRSVGQLPLTYDVLDGSLYDPQYGFGTGLSYTRFSKRNPQVALEEDSVRITIDVKNTGDIAASEIVPVYVVNYPEIGVMTPTRKLVGFNKVRLEPDESQSVTVTIPLDRLKQIPGDITGLAEATLVSGTYRMQIGKVATIVEIP